MRALSGISALIVWVVVVATATAQPQYQIFDIGVVQTGDTASQGFGVSNAGIAVGRSFQSSGTQAFSWTQGGGIVGLPNLAGRNYCRSDSANDNGIVVGTGSTTAFGSNRLPVVWQNGVVSQLPLPPGETIGDATGVNAAGIAVGSVDGGSFQRGVIYEGASSAIITETTSTGCFFVTAFGISNLGRIVGFGIDPNNAARNVGIVLDKGSAQAFEVGALPGFNGALAFAVSNNNHVVGSSMLNQGSGLPFIYTDAVGMIAIPLATGTSQGSARGVNSAGWVVGDDSSAFSIPFLWDGTTTYRLADLLPPGSGWDLDMNTSSSALGISDNGIIVGTGVHNGNTHAYAMVPVTSTPTPTPTTTPTPTASSTPTPTPTPTSTPTPTPTSTPSPSPTATPTPATTPTPPPSPQALNISTRMRVLTDANVSICGFIITGSAPKQVLLRGIGPSLANFGVPNPLADPILCLDGIIAGDPHGPITGNCNDNWMDAPNRAAIEATGLAPTNDLESAILVTLNPGQQYTAILKGNNNGVGVGLVEAYDLGQAAASKLANISTRAFVSTGGDIMIAGFILGGNTGQEKVIVRGIGPSLSTFGVPNALADPTLELRNQSGTLIRANDNWMDDPAQKALIMAAGLGPTNPLESAIAETLSPGQYTALLAGKNSGTGVGLVEVYDLGAPSP